ncbi:HAMP domain-containing protein, partial [Escherichia coli]|uniref:HAMP domain-containing protein n=1 Tax=Escherichia coli TaxID=562 RepID=UPI00227DC732
SYQDNFEQSYNVYLEQNGKLYQIAVDGSNSSYNSAIWTLIVVLVVVLAVIVLVWTGIHHSLVRPLNRMIDHSKQIAAGDLTSRVEVRSHNEIGQLFAALKRMQ